MGTFDKFEEMRRRGIAPLDAYIAAKQDGLDSASSIRMLREIFALPLADAKKIAFLGDTGTTAEEHGQKHTDDYLKIIDDELGPI